MSQSKGSAPEPETHEPEQERRDSVAAATATHEAPPRGAQKERGEGHDGQGRNSPPGREATHARPDPPPQQRPSMMTGLLMTAVVGLIGGVVGAAGYAHFLGAKPAESDSSGKKPDAASVKSGAENAKTEFSGTQSVMESNSRTASSIPGFTASDDAGTLKKQIADLAQRIDGLSGRVDRLSRPKDETPPVLHTMQIKMGELARLMDDVASLPAQVRHYDNRLESMGEEIKALRSRVESLKGARGAGSNPTTLSPQASASASPATDELADNPSMKLGVTLLERGEYASAREIFLRLELTEPRNALVWYLGSLATGLNSGKWDGEAMQFAEKGIERERAGTPSTAQIDAILATRSPIKGVPWLNALRRKSLTPTPEP